MTEDALATTAASLHADALVWDDHSGFEPDPAATPEQLPELTELMLRAGYPEAAIRAVLGENFLRVARVVWPGIEAR